MKVVTGIDEVRSAVKAARAAGKLVGLVPTMGKLHEGHYSLIDAARRDCGWVAASIFVNPTQFGPGEDFETYPRSPEQDEAGCRRRGVDLLFVPSVETMYPRPGLTVVSSPTLSDRLCGRSRPGHFDGVCTVVAKLFNIFQPDRAYFGAKDFQQSVVVRRMAGDLDFPVEVVVCPTVREADGLAMSSRNAYLSPAQRAQASALSEALALAERMIRSSHPAAREVADAVRRHLASQAPDGIVDYVEVADPVGLTNVRSTDRPVLVALAVRFAGARLIDNRLVD
jgi:pantoate--beta-alanine ligase